MSTPWQVTTVAIINFAIAAGNGLLALYMMFTQGAELGALGAVLIGGFGLLLAWLHVTVSLGLLRANRRMRDKYWILVATCGLGIGAGVGGAGLINALIGGAFHLALWGLLYFGRCNAYFAAIKDLDDPDLEI